MLKIMGENGGETLFLCLIPASMNGAPFMSSLQAQAQTLSGYEKQGTFSCSLLLSGKQKKTVEQPRITNET